MKSSAIYHKVDIPTRKSDRSYGADDYSVDEIRVGSSASNSHTLGTVTVRKEMSMGEVRFYLSVDGTCIKKSVFDDKGNGVAGKHIGTYHI